MSCSLRSVLVGASILAPVQNGGFEDPSFAGWGWYARAQASYRSITENPHSGVRCVQFTNTSDLAPEVYGRLYQVVPVLPGVEYELSVWVRGEDVRPAIHLTDWDRYTLPIPPGTYGWQRISTTFRTGDAQTALNLGINIVDRCKALRVDDVVLRPVGQRIACDGLEAAFFVPRRVEGDNVDAPIGIAVNSCTRADLALEATVQDQTSVLFRKKAVLTAAPASLEWTWNTGATEERWLSFHIAILNSEGGSLAVVSCAIEKIGAGLLRDLRSVEVRMKEVDRRIEECRARGIPVDYPMTAHAVVEQFAPLVREDLRHTEFSRAEFAVSDLNRSVENAAQELDAYLREPSLAPAVARHRTPGTVSSSPLEISGLNFIGDRVDSKGQVTRGPVFFCGYGHFTQVRKDIPRFPDYGVNIIQIEIGPSDVLTTEGMVSYAAASKIAALLDDAAAHNVAVNILLSPHYFPRWALAKWPHLAKGGGGFLPFCIDEPEAKQLIRNYLRTVVPIFRGKPALHSFCLSNEPLFDRGADCDATIAGWHSYLQHLYGDIAALNQTYGTQYAQFVDVPVPGNDAYDAPQFYDYCIFNQERFAAWHQWMADVIHDIAPEIPVHAKMMPITIAWRNSIAWGIDPERFAAFSQISGNDCWAQPVPVRGEKSWAINWHVHNMLYDLQRSLAPQPIFNSENHVTVDRSAYYVPPEQFRAVLWQGAIHGESATTIWVWERSFDRGSDFYGNVMDRPGCAQEVGLTCLDLNQFADEVAALQSQPAPVALLFSIVAIARDADYLPMLQRAYEALSFCGLKIDFISEKQLAAGRASRYRMLVVPAARHVTAPTLEAVVQLGNSTRVVVLGDCFTMDPYNRPFDGRSREGVFKGALALDAAATTDTRALTTQLRDELRNLRALPELSIVDAVTGEHAWGVEWLPAISKDGRTIINMVNLLGGPIDVQILRDNRPVEARDLLVRVSDPTVRRLQPLVPVLAEIQ